jgi:hypothetical protein
LLAGRVQVDLDAAHVFCFTAGEIRQKEGGKNTIKLARMGWDRGPNYAVRCF